MKESETHVICQVRLRKETAARIDDLAACANLSRSKMISQIVNAALEYTSIE